MADNTFDYIVVGSGSAGGIVAARLSENGKHRVLCLEAGHKDQTHFWTKIPAGAAFLFDDPAVNWRYWSEPNEAHGKRQLYVPRGKILGGSSAINGMVYVRGQKQDYDHWAQLGCIGWSYEDVLPMFKKIESYEGGTDAHRGRGGPVRITEASKVTPFYDLLMQSAEKIGIPRNPDYNGDNQEGIAMAQGSIHKGRRQSTAVCYLEPARKRPNLTIQSGAEATSLIMEGKCCVGLRYQMGGEAREARATREVIVSCGTINSPKLLELSGIGQPEVLQRHGIDVVHALAGVGENLRDHFAPLLKYAITAENISQADISHGWRFIREGLRYILFRKGFIAQSMGAARIFFRTREGLESPDAMMAVIPYIPILENGRRRISRQRGLSLYAHTQRTESTGSVHIKSARPEQEPAIDYNFLDSEYDRQTNILAVRKARELIAAPPLSGVVGEELEPGADVQTDEELLEYMRNHGQTTYHPTGTCKMGRDPMAVVDEKLRVHGLQGLRVADASIMPTMTSGNTNAPSMMIGEKCADMILAEAMD
ncbi:MAG: GMC family oxidoreductase N-terminal domain-containing protein [Alphaproteobacteria bacterium]|nr:GMC family oxidoreductase N-terminal domain-containing protein [Alphaproteobacteria bacterium]